MGRYESWKSSSKAANEDYDPDDDYYDDGYDAEEEGEEEEWDEEGAEGEAEEGGDNKKNEATEKPSHADPSQELQIVDKTRAARDQKQKQQTVPKAPALTAEERARFEAVKAGLAEHGIRDAPKTLPAAEKLLDELTSKEEAYTAAVAERKRRQGRAIEELPEEVWGEIVGYLKIKSLMMAGLSSQWLKYVVEMSPAVASEVAHTYVSVVVRTERKQDANLSKKIEKKQQHKRQRWRCSWYYGENTKWYETKTSVSFHHTKIPAEAVPLKFPWDGFNSVRYHILEKQVLHWQDEDIHFERGIAWSEYRNSTWNHKKNVWEVKVEKRDAHPEITAERRKLVDRMVLRSQELLKGVASACWLQAVRDVECMTDADDPNENPLVIFARAKCNAAAGMGNIAVSLSEQLTEKPWEHPLVDKTYATMFGFPSDEKSLQAFLSEMRQSSLDSLADTEEDVTLSSDATIRVKARDVVNGLDLDGDAVDRRGMKNEKEQARRERAEELRKDTEAGKFKSAAEKRLIRQMKNFHGVA